MCVSAHADAGAGAGTDSDGDDATRPLRLRARYLCYNTRVTGRLDLTVDDDGAVARAWGDTLSATEGTKALVGTGSAGGPMRALLGKHGGPPAGASDLDKLVWWVYLPLHVALAQVREAKGTEGDGSA